MQSQCENRLHGTLPCGRSCFSVHRRLCISLYVILQDKFKGKISNSKKNYLIFKVDVAPCMLACVCVPFCSLCNFFFCFVAQKEKKGQGEVIETKPALFVCLGKHFGGGVSESFG